MSEMVDIVSAAGLVGFLAESDPQLKIFALKTLDAQIDLLWIEVVDAIPQMYVFFLPFLVNPFLLWLALLTLYIREALYEDESFPERELAALVAAKVYYNLQEYNESMVFALGAGKSFQLDNGGEFEETIIGEP